MQSFLKLKQRLSCWLNDSTTAQLPKRVPAFDVMNIAACLAVVIIHVYGAFWSFSYDAYWIVCNLAETLFYWAVPIFFMISGATLMDYNRRYSTAEFMKKRLVKTLIPFAVWSVFAILFELLLNGMAIYGGSFSLKKTVDIIFNTRANGLYWFFIALFAVYLAVPVLASIPERSRKKIFTYVIMTAIVTNSLLPLLCRIVGIGMNSSISLPVAGGYVVYLLIGYCITRYPLGRRCRAVIYVMGAVGWLVHFLGTYLLSYSKGGIDDTFKGYLNLPCIMFSIAVFVWFYYRKPRQLGPKTAKLIGTLSSASFGVYLIHYYLIYLATNKAGISNTAWYWLLFGPLAVYGIALLLTLIIKKIPVLKTIVP